MQTPDRHPHSRARDPTRAPPRARPRAGPQRLRALRRALRPATSRASTSSPRSGPSPSSSTPPVTSPSSSPSSRSSACGPRRRSSGSSRIPEYPGTEHPMRILGRVLADMGDHRRARRRQRRLSGHPRLPGAGAERGRRAADVTPLAPLIESMMVRKSAAEVELIRESARWCEHAHRLLQEYSRPGATEARGQPAGGARGHARDARRARPVVRRPAGVGRRRLGRVPRPDRAPERLGPCRRPQHRVPGRATSS